MHNNSQPNFAKKVKSAFKIRRKYHFEKCRNRTGNPLVPRMTKDVSLRLKRRAEKATMRLMSTSICPHDGGAALIARGVYLIFLIIYYIIAARRYKSVRLFMTFTA